MIAIDVPDGYTGDLKDLITADDQPPAEGDRVDGVPAGFVTNWLERAHFDAPTSVDNRVITAFYGVAAPEGWLGTETTG